jgi:transcriptional regulator with XRE-family HTH domain
MRGRKIGRQSPDDERRGPQRKMLRNDICCAKLGEMPLATARKVEALRADFRSAAQLADMLGVSRSQITRWLRGAGIDPLNAEKVDLLELVWSNLLRLYAREAAVAWLFGINPRLGDRRPIDLVRAGRAEELMRAIRAERADSFA